VPGAAVLPAAVAQRVPGRMNGGIYSAIHSAWQTAPLPAGPVPADFFPVI